MALYTAFLAAFVVAFFFLYRYILYPAFFSPLSKIPTPYPITTILPMWIWWKELEGTQARNIFEAHQRYGPVVRFGPNEIHVASLDGLRVVFNSGKFERSDWFLQFSNYNGTPNLLTMLNAKQHATRRRLVSHIFSKSYLLGSVEFQKMSQILLFERMMPIFEDAAQSGESLEVYELGLALSAEFMNAYQVGTGNCLDIVRKGREHERHVYVQTGKTKILELKGYQKAIKDLEDEILEICKKTDDYMNSMSVENKEKKSEQAAEETSESTSTYPVVFAQLKNAIPEKEGPKTQEELLYLIASELIDNVEAARLGMGITLTYILHELTIRPDMQTALREELMTLDQPLIHPPNQNRISTSTLRKLDELPLLNAVVMETLRVRNPLVFPFRRIVPEGGAVINGYFIPAGVIVGSSAYSLHMNPVPYPEPEEWNPKRWLDLQGTISEQVSHKNDQGDMEKGRADDDPRRWFWAFGSGTRMCVGNNFALLVMKLIIATIFTNYTTSIVDDEGIEQQGIMLGSPVGEKLVLGFKRVPNL